MFCHSGVYFLGGAHGNGALIHEHFVILHQLADVGGGVEHVAQVSATVFAGRRGQREEHDLCFLQRFGQIGGEAQAALADVALEQHIQVRFVDGHFAILHHLHLLGIDVHADHVVASLCEACAGDQTDVSCSYYCDVHGLVEEALHRVGDVGELFVIQFRAHG